MGDHPSHDRAPEGDPSDAPLAGPASRVFRYLPEGDPKDRAQRYLGDADPCERAQRYLTDSQIARRDAGTPSLPGDVPPQPSQVSQPSEPSHDSPPPAADSHPSMPALEARSGVSRLGDGAQSALQTMVAAVLEERRAATPPPDAFVAPAPAPGVAQPAIVAPVTGDGEAVYDEHAPAAPPPAGPSPAEHLARLRRLADLLRTAPVSPEGLQPVVDLVGAAVGADAVVLTLSLPRREQIASGTTLGGGPRHAVQVRADGVVAGELMACRLSEREPFGDADDLFLTRAADQLGATVTRASAGSALEAGDQQFVNTLVAELRAPLSTVAGMLEDFAAGNAGALSDVQRGYLEIAAGETSRLLAIIRDLQTLASLRRPEPHELDHIGVGPLLARAAARSAAAAAERGVEVAVEELAEALVVKGVPEQLDRALGAILDNAVKFSHEGGRVGVAAELEDGTVRITVTDDGIGMDPADTALVFDRFARARTAVDAQIPGIGLGLTIVKEVADVHAGRAWAESAAGHGTRVHLALPGVA